MSSPSVSSSVVQALASSSKGRLQYDREWNFSKANTLKTFHECAAEPKLSSPLFRTVSSKWKDRSYRRPQSRESSLSGDENDDSDYDAVSSSCDSDDEQSNGFPGPYHALDQSLEAGKTEVSIRHHEQEGEKKIQEKVDKRRQQFREKSQTFEAAAMRECASRTTAYRQAEQALCLDLAEEMRRISLECEEKRVEAERSRQQKRTERIDFLKQGEAKRHEIAQEERRREEEAQRRREAIIRIKSNHHNILHLAAEAKHLLTQCEHKSHLDESAEQLVKDIERKAEKTKQLVTEAEATEFLVPLVQNTETAETESKTAIDTLKQLIGKAALKAKKAAEEEKAKKEEEVRKKKEAEEKLKQQKQASRELDAKLPAHLKDCISPSAHALYFRLQKKQQEIAKRCESITAQGDAQSKKKKFDLQKAVSVPVNAISSQSAAHLRDKVSRLSDLLNGKTVEVSGAKINVGVHKDGSLFCLDYLAKKLVLQGSQQVSSNHESAFPFAAVTVGLWEQFPELGELLLAHFHSTCPYTVPVYIPKTQGQSSNEHYKALGYRVNEEDGTVESDDKYEKRMSGIIRLYAAIIQSTPPRGVGKAHPHGIEHGWTWLSRLVNLSPRSNITATMLYDFLEVAGHDLMKTYKKQFQKLLVLICKEFYPKIEAVTSESKRGPVTRLKLFLETCIKSGKIPEPKGRLSPSFWTRQATPPPSFDDYPGY
ncbi:mRNA export factor GLE1-like [Oscarella lobularis]|uniref:mRNA export factor GLE1-like n=1 Tax=Oscarella lobularis TaxID=121494 RepID=UPI0033143DA6